MSNKRKNNQYVTKQTQTYLNKIVNNPIVQISTIIGIIVAIFTIFDLRVHQSTSCLLKADIDEKYILRNQHDEEIQNYKLQILNYEQEIEELQNKIENQNYNVELIKRYDALVKERKGFENELNNIINFSNGIKNGDLQSSQNPKKEELLRKIQSTDEKIKILLEKIK